MKTKSEKYFEISTYGEMHRVRPVAGVYENGSPAIELICDDGIPLSKLTVNVGELPLKNTVWIKTWSENTEVYVRLIHAGFLKPTDVKFPCGYSEAHACELTDKFKEFFSESDWKNIEKLWEACV